MQQSPSKASPAGKKQRILRPVLCLVILVLLFSLFAVPMGLTNMINTMMNTAYRLLIDTALYIMALAVMTGALAGIFAEYGVIGLLNRLLSPVMKPLYGMPGAATVGVLTTYLSDNPAILTLAHDNRFRRYFKKYQIPALTNLGTSFGMGLMVTAFMLGIRPSAGSPFLAVVCGNLGAIIGSVVSTRLMLRYTASVMGKTEDALEGGAETALDETEDKHPGGTRFITVLMEGGKTGVELGLGIIPGVLIICTFIMMLTCGPADGGYTGGAYEGIALLPWVAQKIQFLLTPLFGFSDPAAIAVPVTALGSAGAAMGAIPGLAALGKVSANDLAVFTAMCMCWSGYLSTHVSMMDVLGSPEHTGKAILFHTVGGLCAGVAAHWLYMLLQLIF